MQAKEFAQAWLEQEGLMKPETDYGGDVARSVLAVIDLIEKQNHSGASMFQFLNTVRRLYDAYNDSQSPIWKAWHARQAAMHPRDRQKKRG